MSKTYVHCFWRNILDFSWLKLSTFKDVVGANFNPGTSRAIDVLIGMFVLVHITSKLAAIVLTPTAVILMLVDRPHLTIDLCLVGAVAIAFVTNAIVTHVSMLLSFLSANILGYPGPQVWSKSNDRY
jgi:hypothetical protein